MLCLSDTNHLCDGKYVRGKYLDGGLLGLGIELNLCYLALEVGQVKALLNNLCQARYIHCSGGGLPDRSRTMTLEHYHMIL